MKRILWIILLGLFPLVGISQVVIDLDKTYIDSTWGSIDVDTLYLARDSIYITGSGDTLLLVSDKTWVSGRLFAETGLDFPGTYTDNVIDLSNITIDYTGSSGPSPIRIGTYGTPLANADEDQSGMLRLYGQTSADGTSYDRGVFVALKTTGTKNVMPIAGLAEILAQAGNGPTNVHAGEFIAHLNSATAKLADGGVDAWAGLAGIWAKVTSNVGSTTAAGTVIAPIWADNQMNGTVSGEEYAFYVTSGSEPDAVFGFEASASNGWDQLFYFDETCYNLDPVSNTSLKVKVNATQYYIPLSTSDASFTWGYPLDITGTVAVTGNITALKTTEQLRLSYDASYYLTTTVLADGHTTFTTVDAVGAEADINFTPDGNVGIKTAAPGTALEVTGTITSTDIIIPSFASPTSPVVYSKSTGELDTLATDDIGDIAFTLSGAMTYVSTEGLMTIGTGGTFERLNEGAIAYTGAHLHDFTHDDGRLTYTGTNTKHFTINVRINIEGDENAQLVQLQLYKDGALIAATNDQHDYVVQDTDDSVGFTWLVEMATNEYVEVHGTSDTNAD